MKTYLLTRPEHDDTTYYISSWFKETINEAENSSFKVLDLHKARATRIELESMIDKNDPKIVALNGHGTNDMVAGHKNEPLVIAGQNEKILKSKIVHALSCSSAKNLGIKSVQSGAKSYVGYDDVFVFDYDPSKSTRPLQDTTAELFLRPPQLLVESLIKGNSVRESIEKAKIMMKNNLVKSLSSTDPDKELARHLFWNLQHLIAHGELDLSV